MKNNIEKTLFFIKPYIDPKKAREIIAYRDSLFRKENLSFKVIEQFEALNFSNELWFEFYSQIGQKSPEVLKEMANDFASCCYGLVGNVLIGENIIDRLRNILGERIIENNKPWQIRSAEKYGYYNNPERKEYRTVAHASTKDVLSSKETQVEKDFMIFKREGIINSVL